MKSLKIISMCVLSVFSIGIVNAQKSTRSKIVTCEVNNSLQVVSDLSDKVLKSDVKNQTVRIVIVPETQSVSLSFDSTKVAFATIEKKLQAKGYVLTRKKEEMAEAKVRQPAEKYNPKIDKFLSREDVSIFGDNFMELKDVEIHPRSRNYYQLIKNIHNLSEYLANVEETLSNVKVEKTAKEMTLPKETVKSLLRESAKKDIEKAEQKLVDIIPFAGEIEFLSPEQAQYYKSLKDKFNDLYNIVYPE